MPLFNGQLIWGTKSPVEQTGAVWCWGKKVPIEQTEAVLALGKEITGRTSLTKIDNWGRSPRAMKPMPDSPKFSSLLKGAAE